MAELRFTLNQKLAEMTNSRALRSDNPIAVELASTVLCARPGGPQRTATLFRDEGYRGKVQNWPTLLFPQGALE